MRDLQRAATGLFDSLLARAHLAQPADAATVVVEEVQRALGASDAVVYWVDREQRTLVPLASDSSPTREPEPVDGSVPGEAFVHSRLTSTLGSASDRRRVLVPLIDGTDRLGVLDLEVPAGPDGALPDSLVQVLERYGHAVAQLLMTKLAYGDSLHLPQRTRPMDLGAELLWSVLPPLTFATEGLVITAVLEPVYENGGDAFEYAVNPDVTHLAVMDGAGHGLAAAGLSTFAVAAHRHSRRQGLDLAATYAAMDDALGTQFAEELFVTAVLAQLDRESGVLRWINAGHPPPLLLRADRRVEILDAEPATPLGLPLFGTHTSVNEVQLEPGDALVLYTDGVTEARLSDGSFLGVEALVDFLRREENSSLTAVEVLRQLRLQLLGAEGTVLRDDATVMLVVWQGEAEQGLLPSTV